jgi:16S rRNA (cytosine1402-N4)-methyltransferase
MTIHKTVLLEEAIEMLNLKPGDTAVDSTLGGGGHSREILKRIMPGGKLIAIDRDETVISRFRESLKNFPIKLKAENWLLIHSNYSRLGEILNGNKILRVHGIMADLGLSSIQLEDTKRGFSFNSDGPLDMRMDEKENETAGHIINNYSEESLEKILKNLGEEKFSRRIARAIVNERSRKRIEGTRELVDIIGLAVPQKYHFGKIHFATRTFQAIRMEVNQELTHLGNFIAQAIECLNPGGRLVIISFHSGEDRMVKQYFRENARGCICPKELPVCRCKHRPLVRIITKKPIQPSDREIADNPRARSAKMRVVEKI